MLGKLHEYHDVTGQALKLTTSPIVFMVASHNRDSIILTVQEMQKHQVSPSSGVVQFGQLYGMQDQISYALGKNGYPIFNICPMARLKKWCHTCYVVRKKTRVWWAVRQRNADWYGLSWSNDGGGRHLHPAAKKTLGFVALLLQRSNKAELFQKILSLLCIARSSMPTQNGLKLFWPTHISSPKTGRPGFLIGWFTSPNTVCVAAIICRLKVRHSSEIAIDGAVAF